MFKKKIENPCSICGKDAGINPAKIEFTALNDDGDPMLYQADICKECEKMMEKFDEFYKQKGTE